MSGMRNAVLAAHETSIAFLDTSKGTCGTVMSVLAEIRPLQSNGLAYDENTNLTDAGFTSVEMVKVMLGVEAAFDLMIPQHFITPEHFTNASAIAAMIETLIS
jgi:acyl carrier protein